MNKIVKHPFNPVYNRNSKILFLGSIASVKSREIGYPYASPQNRFWKVMKSIFNEEIVDYKHFLLNKKIALWDVIKSCEITGSAGFPESSLSSAAQPRSAFSPACRRAVFIPLRVGSNPFRYSLHIFEDSVFRALSVLSI